MQKVREIILRSLFQLWDEDITDASSDDDTPYEMADGQMIEKTVPAQ